MITTQSVDEYEYESTSIADIDNRNASSQTIAIGNVYNIINNSNAYSFDNCK